MRTPIPHEVKMFLKPCLLQHIVRIPTHRENLALLHVMVIIQSPSTLKARNGPLVNHRLSIIFTMRLQTIQLKQSVRGRIKFQIGMPQIVHFILYGLVFNSNGCILHKTRILESTCLGKILKIIPVQCPAKAFPPKDLIFLQFRGDTTIGVHVREVQLASRFEKAVTRFQYRLFIGAEIDDTITDNNIHTLIFERRNIIQFFNQSQVEFNIVISKLFRMIGLCLLRHLELFFCHIHTNNPSLRPDQLTGNVHIPSRTASQIQNGHSLDFIGDAESTSVVLSNHIGVNVLNGRCDMWGRRGGRAACIGFEV
mmetsp:Transcript_4760/g.6217  ORF Transcript_4760/g.6217 Transcript_4760/m.6217 type:complete len:310 (-) Transcript_4760:201-1130(-)